MILLYNKAHRSLDPGCQRPSCALHFQIHKQPLLAMWKKVTKESNIYQCCWRMLLEENCDKIFFMQCCNSQVSKLREKKFIKTMRYRSAAHQKASLHILPWSMNYVQWYLGRNMSMLTIWWVNIHCKGYPLFLYLNLCRTISIPGQLSASLAAYFLPLNWPCNQVYICNINNYNGT